MRRRRAEPRVIQPDPKYGNVEVARFITKLMLNGKKTLAQRTVYQAMDRCAEESNRAPLDVFNEALLNATPIVQVKPRRVGGATYQVPVEVNPRRGRSLGMRWLITSARARKGRPIREKLAQELLEASRVRERLSGGGRTCTGWQKPIEHLRITAGKEFSSGSYEVDTTSLE